MTRKRIVLSLFACIAYDVSKTIEMLIMIIKLLRCLIRPSLRHEKHRSFLFSRLDLLNRTDPGEAVRNVEYIL